MRLREIAEAAGEFDAALRRLRGQSTKIATGAQGYAVEGLEDLARLMPSARSLPLGPEFTKRLNQLAAHPLASSREGFHASPEEWSDFTLRRGAVLELLEMARSMIASVVPAPRPGLFVIRLPQQQSGLDSLASDVRALSEVFEQALRRTLKEEIEVVGVDRGSTWIEILAKSTDAAKLLLELFGIIVGFNKLRNELRRDEEETRGVIERAQAEARKAKAEASAVEAIAASLQHLAVLNKLKLDVWLNEKVAGIIDPLRAREDVRIRIDDDAENTVRNSVRQGADLLDRGVTMVRVLTPGSTDARAAALGAPEEPRGLPAGEEKKRG